MADRSFLAWPFFEPRHRELADKLERWSAKLNEDDDDLDSRCRTLVSELGSAGFLKLCVADGDRRPDVRSLAIAREALAHELASGPSRAHSITKRQLDAEWAEPIEIALDMEAEAQAALMQSKDFKRAYEAFAAKRTPEFRGD